MRILYGTDGSRAAVDALAVVLSSLAVPADGVIDVVAVEPPGFGFGIGADEIARTNIEAAIAQCAAEGVSATGTMLAGDPAAQLIMRARRTLPDVVVLGADRCARPAGDPVAQSIGHVAATVTLAGHASVLIATGRGPIARIVLGADGSVETERAIELLSKLPFLTQPELDVVTVRDPTRPQGAAADDPHASDAEMHAIAQAIADDTAARLATMALRMTTRTPVGRPAEQLAVAANERGADLLVVGTRGLGPRQRRRLGSVSAELLERMPASLLIVRAGPDAG
jgi:nucleotide-binding universal stress UspA family protein